MNPYISESSVRVRYQETDQMGIVYHANYLVWFEIGRTDYIRQLGFSYRKLEELGLLLPVVDVHCRFLQPARYDDELLIHTSIKAHNGSKLVFYYEAKRKKDQQLLARGSTTHLWTTKTMKRVNIRQTHSDIYKKLKHRKVSTC